MIGFTPKAKHSIAIMLAVATSERLPLAAKDIAASTGMSIPHADLLLSRLKSAGLLASSRGPGGGYSLGRAADKISLHTIIACAAEFDGSRLRGVMDNNTADTWQLATTSVTALLTSMSLADMLNSICMPNDTHRLIGKELNQ